MTRRAVGVIVAALAVAIAGANRIVDARAGAATAERQGTAPAAQASIPQATTAEAISAAIDQLGVFDLGARTKASRALRRAPAELAVPALGRAARSHRDEYVRYRALVLLTGFGDASAAPVMRDLLADRDNRLRLVAYGWFGFHPDASVLPQLLSALDSERSEFVRPALTHAVAAYGDDPAARAALLPLITRGEDLFRGAVIEALGDNHARYALGPIGDVAKLDGPLQDEAILALGKIGDRTTLATLSALQQTAPDDVQPAIAASVCLITRECTAQVDYLKKTLAFATSRENSATLLSRVAHALGVLAIADREPAIAALFDAGVTATDPARSVIAVSIGTVALGNPAVILTALESRTDPTPAVALLREAFDLLSEEDYGQERFFIAVRSAAASALAGSKRRQVAAAVIDTLEF
jgi:HEAT repeat protein